MQSNNIVLTGGHAATTAIAIIEEIKKKYEKENLYWIGPKSAFEGKFIPSISSSIMPTLGVTYIPIVAGRIQRKFTVWTIPALLKIPVGLINAFKILTDIKPSKIISFGGYASVPVCIAGWILKIPVFIHEQTVAVGRANRFCAPFAKKIFIAREESRIYFPKDKVILVGNPVSETISKIKPKKKLGNPPVIYITGGSRGAQRINKVIRESLYELVKIYRVIHQTGILDFEEFKKKREDFPLDLKKNYEVYDFLDPKEIPSILERSDLIISRAGANTVSEIMIAKRPSILIPIPWTAYDEQLKNAKMAEKSGIALVLEEKDLSSENLILKIDYIFKNWAKMIKNSDDTLANLDRKASKKLVEEL